MYIYAIVLLLPLTMSLSGDILSIVEKEEE